jgi:glycosyltransferase involved in cell wall biosynthesis
MRTDTARERTSRRGNGAPPPVHLALYGEIDMNLIDGSSVWVQSVAQMLTTLPQVELTLLLRCPEERDLLTAPLRAHPRIELVDPTSLGYAKPLAPAQALEALERLDLAREFDLVLLRGSKVSELAAGGGAFAARLWLYYLPPHEPHPEGEIERLRLLSGACERLLCQTEPIRALVEALVPEQAGKLLLLPPMIPAAPSRPHRPRSGPLKLLYAGKFAPEYYFLEMVETFRRLRRTHPGAELHLVGDKIHNPHGDPGFKPAAEAALAETENLVWHGGVGRDRVASLMAEADVALSIRHPMMARSRELSTKVLEYGAAGCAVMLNRTPLYEELLGPEYPLFALDPGEALAALIRVSDDSDVWEQAAARCQAAAAAFTYERVAARLEHRVRPPSRRSGPDRHAEGLPDEVGLEVPAHSWDRELAWELGRRAVSSVGLDGEALMGLRFGPLFASFRVERPGLFLRVGAPGYGSAFEALDRDLKLSAWLDEAGFPVPRPAAELHRGPAPVRATWAGFWRWEEHDPAARPEPRAAGELLARLHQLLADCPIPLPTMDQLGACRRRAARLRERSDIGYAAGGFLLARVEQIAAEAERFSSRLGSGAIHGGFGLDSLLLGGRGLVLAGFDRARVGPREWDLVRAEPGRPGGWRRNEWSAFASGYGYDPLRGRAQGLRELEHLGHLLMLLDPGSPFHLREWGRRLLLEWQRNPERRCRELSWAAGSPEPAP